MKILLLTSSYPSHHEDVHSTFMRELSEALSGMGILVVVLCPHQNGLPFHEIQDGITIYRYPYWFSAQGQHLGDPGGIIPSVHQSIWAIFQLIPFCILQFVVGYKVIRKEKIELIHSHWLLPQGITAALLHMIMNIPHIASVHGTDIHIIHSHQFLHFLLRFISQNSNNITTNSHYTSRLVHEIVINRSIRVIPMGIHEGEFIEPSFTSKEQNSEKVILFVGRLIEIKGIAILIKSLSVVQDRGKNYTLKIVGDGPMKEELQELAKNVQVSDSVQFLGRKSRKHLRECYSDADIFVLPSIMQRKQAEGLGVVLLEAMASGIPVIGSNIGGIPDIIENGVNGLLVPPGDPDALADAIIRVLEDPDFAKKIGAEGLKTVKTTFSWEKIAGNFTKLYLNAGKSINDR